MRHAARPRSRARIAFGFLTYRGKKFRPSGGTFGRLWNGLRSVSLVGETAVLRQPEGGPTVRPFSIPFRLKSCKICVNFSTTHCQNVLYLICKSFFMPSALCIRKIAGKSQLLQIEAIHCSVPDGLRPFNPPVSIPPLLRFIIFPERRCPWIASFFTVT